MHAWSHGSRNAVRVFVKWWWAWEVLATTISIAATIALIVVLAKTDGRIQKSWTVVSSQLTLNTIVAAISTVIRAALLVAIAGPLNQGMWNRFSSKKGASGPARPLKDLELFGGAASDSWGSIRLLWRTKGCNLAALGAGLTVVSLAFDAFAQQLLTIDALNVRNETIDATIAPDVLLPLTLNYTGETIPSVNDGMIIHRRHWMSRVPYVSSILNSPPLPAGICPTGNCTWPTTPSLATCSTCSNMTLSPVIALTNVTYSALWGDLVSDRGGNVSLFFRNSVGGNKNVNISILASSAAFNLEPGGRLPIVNFYLFGIPPGKYQKLFSSYNPPSFAKTDFLDLFMVAYNCSLNFCLQSFSASTTAGKSQQGSVDTWDQMTASGIQNWTFTNVPANKNMGNINASTYSVDLHSLTALGDAFTPFMTGSVLLQGNMLQLQYAGVDGSTTHGINSFAQAFYQASDSFDAISTLARQIATGMTTYLRSSRRAAPDKTYTPDIFSTEIVVRVRWAWLAFPLALVVAAHVFLVATICQTRRQSVRPWKGHRLPLLMANIDDVVGEIGNGGLETRNGLEDRVRRLTVKLEFDERDKVIFRRVQK